uniref:Uncharacterized protein LOC100178511 n=1 Tax=Phallusia mammillata TaxID=59560 RepID=A0A6F9DG51_9ASCI|nr:uncharacterized protein LOC100178511 [Phallusia mammillata]
MTEEVAESITLDAETLIEDAVAAVQDGTEGEVTQESDIVSKAFTSVEEDNSEVQYVTMTPEEAAAAGVVEDEQVVTTSLQFDPANPSVLYTADGTLINQSDLSPEEQALVQAALQQHLAEQEAEQQLAMIDQSAIETDKTVTADGSETGVTSTSTNLLAQASTNIGSDPVATITATSSDAAESVASSVNLASPNTNASQIVQTLANNVRRQQEYMKAQHLLNQVKQQEMGGGYSRFEEKIVIRQGQPQVVKVPVKTPMPKKQPEIPAALANLMPKIEVGKDGSQVIRIHQSQITADQLKSLQENPNVRLVFRPASSSKGQSRPNIPGMPSTGPRKRGRPRKNMVSPAIMNSSYDQQMDDSSPPSKTRYGRMTKQPYYQKDYASPNGEVEDGDEDYRLPSMPSIPRPQHVPGRRGRPPGALNRSTLDKQAYRRSNSYAHKIEALREQEEIHDDDVTTARLAITSQKPVLSSVEQAISTRRKNRLRELLSACSEDEIMEVALPHLARVFSLWEFLVMKVEKNKLSRVYFADVYKEYEALHKYVCRLTDKYKETIDAQKSEIPEEKKEDDNTIEQNAKDALDRNKNTMVTIRCKKTAESLGLDQNELEDAVISLLDSEPLQKPAVPTAEITQNSLLAAVAANQISTVVGQVEDSNKPVQTEATSTNSPLVVTEASGNGEQSDMPALAPLNTDSAATTNKKGDEDAAPSEAMDVDQATGDQPAEAKQPQEDAQVVTTLAEGHTVIAPSSDSAQIIQIGTGDDKQFIEVPEGYTLIQTPEGLVMSQPGTTLSQAEDGTIYVTQEDGTTAPLDSQKGVPLETVESLLSLDGQQPAQEQQQQ